MVQSKEYASVQERPAAGMAWAVDESTRAPVYVGKLSREKTGLRCGCICPACNAKLQAVNAGSTGGQLPFFRHHVGQQGPGCKSRVAELAALRLLAEKGLIEIPAPRKRSMVEGISGRLYPSEAVGSPIREKIVERRLVSEAAAIIKLESGREVALVLRGHQDVSELGSVFAVVEVQVDDPEVAWLSPEEILGRSELSAQWLHVVSHGDDGALQAQADEMARKRALEHLDIVPEELNLPVGATGKQASESVLHWAVKKALTRLRTLQGPELVMSASAVGRSGQRHTVPVVIPSVQLEVVEVAEEVLFEGYRADIVCLARDARRVEHPGARLLIEVAVTSKVKPEKLRLIKDADVACIELDVAKFAHGGMVTVAQLDDLVGRDISSKVWLHHPAAAKLMAQAQVKANEARDRDDAHQAADALKEAERKRVKEALDEEARAREAAKLSWVKSLAPAEAMGELKRILRQRWVGRPELTSNGMGWEPGEFERALGLLMPRRALEGDVLRKGGIAWRLASICYRGRHREKALDVGAVLGVGARGVDIDLEQWLGLLHMAIDECKPVISEGLDEYEKQRMAVMDSLTRGERDYVRQTSCDALLAGLFPELGPVFDREIGTMEYSSRVKARQALARQQAETEASEAEHREAMAREAAMALEAAEAERRRLPEAVAAVTYQWMWKPNLAFPTSAVHAIECLKYTNMNGVNERMRDLVVAGFEARAAGAEFGDWFSRVEFASVNEVVWAREVLEAAWLVQSKLTLARAKQAR